MPRLVLASLGLALFAGSAVLAPTASHAVGSGELGEVEAARANARAGGPVSEHDKYLLDRYGALSGTPGFSPGGTYRLKPHYGYRHKHRHRH